MRCAINNFEPFCLVSRGRMHEFNRPVVMGILNVTPDSFFDGGRYEGEEAMLQRTELMIAEGVDVVDIGASSSRPGALLLSPDEEATKLAAAVRLIRSRWPEVLISVDTCYSLPAREAIMAGADMVNDISGGQLDEAMFPLVAEMQVPYLLMHMRGTPDTMQQQVGYDDIIEDLTIYFSERLDRLYSLGVKDVWLDPGFGFAKTVDENHELLRRIGELTSLFREPMVAAMSRKSMIYRKLQTSPDESLEGTVALDALALDRGCRVVRVHDIRPARETIRLMYE